jgi:hypothetical protein
MEGGQGRVQQMIRLKQLAEEEDLSDNEIQQQVEINEYYKHMREKSLKDKLKQMDMREKEMEEELGGLVVDEH